MEDWTTFDGVYEPREDSALIRTVLEEEPLSGRRVCDMGTGTGILAAIAAEQGATVVAVDSNPEALRNAQENLVNAGISGVELVESDLFEGVDGTFDCIVCNPPYVPGPVELGTAEEAAWQGGDRGRAFIDRFIAAAPAYLREEGCILMLQSSKNGVDETEERFASQGLTVSVVAEEKVPWERLFVVRATYTD